VRIKKVIRYVPARQQLVSSLSPLLSVDVLSQICARFLLVDTPPNVVDGSRSGTFVNALRALLGVLVVSHRNSYVLISCEQQLNTVRIKDVHHGTKLGGRERVEVLVCKARRKCALVRPSVSDTLVRARPGTHLCAIGYQSSHRRLGQQYAYTITSVLGPRREPLLLFFSQQGAVAILHTKVLLELSALKNSKRHLFRVVKLAKSRLHSVLKTQIWKRRVWHVRQRQAFDVLHLAIRPHRISASR